MQSFSESTAPMEIDEVREKAHETAPPIPLVWMADPHGHTAGWDGLTASV